MKGRRTKEAPRGKFQGSSPKELKLEPDVLEPKRSPWESVKLRMR